MTGADTGAIRRDTARFDDRQWYVDGYASHWFSTEKDAEAALSLARQVARNERAELGRDIQDAINKVLP